MFREVHLWSKLRHKNIVCLLGITTTFDFTVSIVSEWMGKGNAHDYVQDESIDPRPLVSGSMQRTTSNLNIELFRLLDLPVVCITFTVIPRAPYSTVI